MYNTDPLTFFFDLNDELIKRVHKIRYIFYYTYFAGSSIAFISGIVLLVLFFGADVRDEVVWELFFVITMITSTSAAIFSIREIRFFDDFCIGVSSVKRANKWNPHAQYAEADPVQRVVEYLSATDERFSHYYQANPTALLLNTNQVGKSKKTYGLDAYYYGKPRLTDYKVEGIRVIVKVVPEITLENVKALADAANDLIKTKTTTPGKAGPVRVLLVQKDGSEIPDDVINYALANKVKYRRDIGRTVIDWESPIELLAVDGNRFVYGTLNFG